MRGVVAALSGVGLLIAAGLVAGAVPPRAVLQGPIPVSAAIGQRAEGRDLAVTVRDVELARTLRSNEGAGTTSGVWLVARVRAETRLTSGAITGRLMVGDRVWSASSRPSDAIDDATLAPGLPVDGELVFELPRSALTDGAVLQLGRTPQPQLDSVIRLRLDLAGATIRPSVRLDPVQGVAP